MEKALHKTQAAAYSKGTIRNLLCQWRSFIRFSVKYKVKERPVSTHTICLYAQYLAYNFKSARSVKAYVYGLHSLHVLTRVVPPAMDDIEVRITFMGLNKKLITPVKQAQPITPEILLDILAYLDLSKWSDLVFWGSLLVGFFGMLRKSNLIPDTKDSFDAVKQLTRAHIQFWGELVILSATWMKMIQNRQRVLEIPLFPINDSPLYPVTMLKAILASPGKPHHPLFGKGKRVSFSYYTWQKKFRSLLRKVGYREQAFSSHSMRRGV